MSAALRVSVDPPVLAAGSPGGELAIRVEIVAQSAAQKVPRPALIGWVGPAQPLDSLRSLSTAERPVQAVSERGITALGPVIGFSSLARALEAVVQLTPGPTRVMLLVNQTQPENHAALISHLEPMISRGVAIDCIAVHPKAELSTLRLVARSSGGELRYAPGEAAILWLNSRLRALLDEQGPPLGLRISLPSQVDWLRLLRVWPSPEVLPFETEGRQLVLPVDALLPGQRVVFVLVVTVPRRRRGVYRLAELALMRLSGEELAVAEAQVSWVNDPLTAAVAEAGVAADLDRALPAAWVDEATRAHRAGDARRSVAILDQLVRHYTTLGALETAQIIAGYRFTFLRAGRLAQTDFNHLQQMVSGTFSRVVDL